MKARFSRHVAAVLIVSAFVLPEALFARERRGAEVIITLKDGHYAVGELIAVKPGSLLILAEKDVSIELAGIRSVRVVKKSKALLGMGCGVLAGVTASAIYRSRADDVLEAIDMIGAAVMFVGSGLGVGLGAGLIAGKDKVFQFESMSELEVKRALPYLRRKARIRDYR
jgi:ABC-type uncharacterized transport system permease subunit